jgi:hypothetical protein
MKFGEYLQQDHRGRDFSIYSHAAYYPPSDIRSFLHMLAAPLLPIERSPKGLADDDAWPPAYKTGQRDGRALRLKGAKLPYHLVIGIDAYALGSRAGYFDRMTERRR